MCRALRIIIFIVICCRLHTVVAQQGIPLEFTDDQSIKTYFLTKDKALINRTDTLYLLNKPSFEQYHRAHRLLFAATESYEGLILNLESRDSLLNLLYNERRVAYDSLISLNKSFYDKTGVFIKNNADTLHQISFNLGTVKSQLDRADGKLDEAVTYIKKAKWEKYRYLLIGLLAGGITGYILK